MRLIDANELLEDIESAKENHGMGQIVADTLTRYVKRVPTIDPETLPIVRELQDKLKHVITERDEARRDCAVAESNHSECLAQLAKARVQLKSAITDMEALMWHSGDGCNICSHCVEVHREPYVRLDCGLGGSCECKPEWRGVAP